MKTKDEKKSIKTQLKRTKSNELIDIKWIITITLIAFAISMIFSSISEIAIPNVNEIIGLILIVVVIILGILFDMIGVAVTSADEKPFHSMNSRKIKGADIAVLFKKNADKVSSFCNDVVGDICGIISGGAGSIIAIKLAPKIHIDTFLTTLIITAFIAAITIGGKALGKTYAINKSNIILYKFSKFVSYFYKVKK